MFVAAVSAAPEADPQFAYTVGSSPLVYAPYPLVHHAVQYTVPATGCRNDAGAIVPCAGAAPFVAPFAAPLSVVAPAAVDEPAADESAVVVERKRREAEAEPEAAADADAEADPWLLYGGYGYAAPYAYHAYSPYAYHRGYYGHYPYAYAHPYAHYSYFGRKKRDADATPEADADAYYGYPYAYGLGYAAPYAYGYAAPYAYGYAAYGGCRNNYGALVPCAGR